VVKELRTEADRRFEETLARTGARDPREYYREQLRELRESDAEGYRRAVEYFETRLVPAVASPEGDSILEWMEYGRLLARLRTPGEAVRIDATGRSTPYVPPADPDDLVLHLPTSARERAMPIGLPPRLTPPQRAAYELLVQWKTD
jgi:hypothetical protein